MKNSTGKFLSLFLTTIAISFPLLANSQANYPDKPIRLIVAFPAGGSTDIIGRLVAQRLSERLGQSIVVENRGGAGGTIGTDIASKAAPDGYTLTLGTTSTMAVAPSAYSKLGYDPIKLCTDFFGCRNALPTCSQPRSPSKHIGRISGTG